MAEVFSTDAHLRGEDGQLFSHEDRAFDDYHRRAARELTLELTRRGFFPREARPAHVLLDEKVKATVALTITATSDGPLVVPAGWEVRDHDPAMAPYHGYVAFVVDEAVTIPADGTETVSATAMAFGDPYNVRGRTLKYPATDLANLSGVTNILPATGGADHALTRACVYWIMHKLNFEWSHAPDDKCAWKFKEYKRQWMHELDLIISAGLPMDTDGDGEASDSIEELRAMHGPLVFERS